MTVWTACYLIHLYIVYKGLADGPEPYTVLACLAPSPFYCLWDQIKYLEVDRSP